MANNIPITAGTGSASVATENVGGFNYQKIEVYGGGGTSVMSVNPDGSISASIIGTPTVNIGSSSASIIAVIPSSVITVWKDSSVLAVPVGSTIAVVQGSVSAFQGGTRITSLVSAIPSSVLVGASIFGQLPSGTAVLGSVAALQGTNPWIVNGSVSGAMNVSGSVLLGSSNASVITIMQGSVAAAQIGTQIVSVISATPSSMLAGASIFGQLPAGTAMLGSVVAYQGTTPWSNTNVGSIITITTGSVIAVLQSSSIIGINAGSVVAISQGSVITTFSQSPSIVGTYAEDAGSSTGDKGIFVLGVRNDTVASLVSADLDYGARAQDSAGRTLIKPFSAEESRVEGYNSVVSTSVTTLVAAAGVGLRNYITDIMVANTGATTTLVTFKDGAGSILGYTIAPTGGGSNLIGFQMPMRTGANATFDFQPTSASSVLFATVKGYKAP